MTRSILPSELFNLEEDEIIIVNRSRINLRLVTISLTYNVNDEEQLCDYIILNNALRNMFQKEKSMRMTLSGAPMRVGDVLKIFPDIDNMPFNSFSMSV